MKFDPFRDEENYTNNINVNLIRTIQRYPATRSSTMVTYCHNQ